MWGENVTVFSPFFLSTIGIKNELDNSLVWIGGRSIKLLVQLEYITSDGSIFYWNNQWTKSYV
ncbi:hypothetical protein SAMN02982927_00113 [Sporolactobacillus nakayamae]|uniref:Uncharacterized protein n=1 Tax=Sporolactobacillus nakayamae TaxID=269670 RepID=A0A1I2N1H7_9BACL|nr:hypothetical protein SAMN02982927_00113 [Sporolactobacillus nakayamae]